MNQNEFDIDSGEVCVAVMDLLLETGLCDDHPSLTTSLGSLGMDSLKLVEIIFALETRFAITADEELMAELDTVGDLVHMIQLARTAQQAATM